MPRIYPLFALVLAVGCDGKNPALPDGPPGPDGPVATTVTVRVSQESSEPSPGTAVENARVAVVPPGGAPAITLTDATGTAVVDFPAGSTLWVARDPAMAPTLFGGGPIGYLYLYYDLTAGDTVVVGAQPRGTGSTAGVLSVSYTRMIAPSVYNWDGAFSPCVDFGAETLPGQIDFTTYAGCDATRRELVISAIDAASGLPTGWLRVPDVAATAGTVDGTAAAWDTTGTTYTTSVQGVPDHVSFAHAYFLSPGSWHRAITAGPVSAGAGTDTRTDATIPVPAVILSKLDSDMASSQYFADPVATIPPTNAITGAGIPPWISQGRLDFPTRTISWTTITPGTAPQLVTSSFNHYDSVDTTQYRWSIYAAGSRASLVIPDVPDTLVTHDLDPAALVGPDLWLVNIEGSDYADLVTDLDLYRNALISGDASGLTYRPSARGSLSGGYGPQVPVKPQRH